MPSSIINFNINSTHDLSTATNSAGVTITRSNAAAGGSVRGVGEGVTVGDSVGVVVLVLVLVACGANLVATGRVQAMEKKNKEIVRSAIRFFTVFPMPP
jgi:hypothetical protein